MIKTPHQLSNVSKKLFMETFSELYEHSPWVVEQEFSRVQSIEKYDDLQQFHHLLKNTLLKADRQLQDALIRAHPMLVGKQAQNNQLTDFSASEQESAGLNNCTLKEITMFGELNQQYFTKFSFPFILAVKGRNRQQVIEVFRHRLTQTLEQERQTALAEINKIAWIRIKDIYEQ